MKLSLCITTFERFEMTNESFAQVIQDERIDDIVLLDDFSQDGSFEQLQRQWKGNSKIRVLQQTSNVGMGRNKRDAVSFARNPWVILFDSDNILTPAYLDALFSCPDVFEYDYEIFMPDWAEPNFDYRKFGDECIAIHTISDFIGKENFESLLNTCNYVVNKEYYLKTWIANDTVKEVDTAWYNYLHLKSEGSFFVVKGMRYFHRVHPGSGWLKNAAENQAKGKEILEMIKQLAYVS